MADTTPTAFDGATARRIIRATRTIERVAGIVAPPPRRGGGGGAFPIFGWTTDATLLDGETAVWVYDAEQVRQTAPGPGHLETLPGGWNTDAAYNGFEEINPDAAADTAPYGAGVYPAQLDPDQDETADFAIGPVPNHTPALFWPVYCTDGSLIFRFWAINAITGSCPE